MKRVLFAFAILLTINGFSQDDNNSKKSNILTYTPSKLLNKGDWDIKLFNNLYTQTKSTFNGVTTTGNRDNFFTSTLEVYTGVSKKARLNFGLILNVKSNTFNQNTTSVFSFNNDLTTSRSGLTNIGLSLKMQPFKSIANFSYQGTLYIPVFKDQAVPNYLDKRSYILESKYFYDTTFGNGNYQFFAELDMAYNFGEKSTDANPLENNIGERFANNSLGVPVSMFLSYFPSSKFTVYVNAQHYELFDMGNKFSQNYTLVGLGTKYQLTNDLNLELSYANFVAGKDTGLGETFNLGLRYLLTK